MANAIASNGDIHCQSGYEVLARLTASSRDGQNKILPLLPWLTSADTPFHRIFKLKTNFRVALFGVLHLENAK
jgi:hypothetical protein